MTIDPDDGAAVQRFRTLLERLGWAFELRDGGDLFCIVGDNPPGLTQHDVWAFINAELQPRLRLAATPCGTVQ
jgi:hypothetical protein